MEKSSVARECMQKIALIRRASNELEEALDPARSVVARRPVLGRAQRRLSCAQVFSSSTSSSSINGVTQKNIQLQCELLGPDGAVQGSAALQGRTQPGGKLGLLQVQLGDGRVLDVGAGGGGGGGSAGDAIDVDVIVD
eukprot:6819886-Prymnesium_polylepis.2